jgi:hypothetical protein
VAGDLKRWWPLLRPCGVLLGDDYIAGWPGVIKAADEFATQVGFPLHTDGPKWYIQKCDCATATAA